MSLINKMLQDLEERRSGTEVLGPLHGQVRAAPPPHSRGVSRMIMWPLAGIGLAALSAGAWWMSKHQGDTPVASTPQPVLQASPLSLKLDHMPPTLPAEAEPAPQQDIAELSVAVQTANADNAGVGRINQDPPEAAPAQRPLPDSSPRPDEAVHKAAEAASPETFAGKTAGTKRIPTVVPPTASFKSSASATASQMKSDSVEAGFEAEAMPVKISKQIKELTPRQHAENEYRRAMNLIEQSKEKEAMSVLESALQADARHSAARQTLAALLLEGKRTDEAMRKLSEGLALDKAQLGLAMMLARLQVERREASVAIDTLQRSLPHAVERPDYRAFLAALLQREGRHKEAIEHYAAALRREPNNGIWWMGAGISLQEENRVAEARDAFTRAKLSGKLSPELLAFVEQKLAQLH